MAAVVAVCGDTVGNPVERCPIIVSGSDGQVHFIEIDGAVESRGDTLSGSTSGSVEVLRQLVAINSTLIAMRKRTEEVLTIQQAEIAALRQSHDRALSRINNNIRRIAERPIAHVASHQPRTAVSTPRQASLSKGPKDLYDLWNEYEHGLMGAKPARLFTSKERGACRFAYSLRMGFWNIVNNMVSKGHTSDTAIDTIYRVYGRNQSVSAILRSIRSDKPSGHPELR